MPNANRVQTQYISTGNPDTVNDATLFLDGSLGQTYDANARAYQNVQLDSGAAALAAPAANDLLYWKDRTKYLVTTDSRMSDFGPTNFRNSVAGVLRNAATAGRYVFALQRAYNIAVKSDGNGAKGDSIIANSGTAKDVTNIAAGSSPTYQLLGYATGAAAGGNINVDLDIPSIP
jgi:hypothetical protein